MPKGRKGILCVVSGPSGSGKTTLCRAAADSDRDENIRYTVSCTTRSPREGETQGRDYYFLSREEFQARIGADEFLEFATVHGNCYGTLKSEVVSRLENGLDVIMDIDVQGAAQIRSCPDPMIREAHVDVFILLESLQAMEERLRGRGTESEAEFQTRLQNAKAELKQWRFYQYAIVSGSREQDLQAFQEILGAERRRVSRLTPSEDWTSD